MPADPQTDDAEVPEDAAPVPELQTARDAVGDEVRRPQGPAPVVRRRGGFMGTFLGGVAAAAIGFGGAVYLLPRLPVGFRPIAPDTAATDALAAQMETMAQEISALKSQQPSGIDAPTLDARLADVQKTILAAVPAPDLSVATSELADLDTRLSALEKRPLADGGVPASAIDAVTRDIAALRTEIAASVGGGADVSAAMADVDARIKAASDAAETLKADALATSHQMRLRADLGAVQAALDSGAPFHAAIEDLAAAGVDVPAALGDGADGIATMGDLRDGFADAARAAISATAVPAAGASLWTTMGTFLRDQTGARSVTPREGNDPDAILSRAEAALAKGDLAAALAGVKTLPDAGQAAMADWVSRAERRASVVQAVADLSAAIL